MPPGTSPTRLVAADLEALTCDLRRRDARWGCMAHQPRARAERGAGGSVSGDHPSGAGPQWSDPGPRPAAQQHARGARGADQYVPARVATLRVTRRFPAWPATPSTSDYDRADGTITEVHKTDALPGPGPMTPMRAAGAVEFGLVAERW